ncbi:MAG: acyl-CoA dehydrogenase family protein [Chloroflexota bacterium]|nr:acyl-CoA dehydrogenase family protein [Chloroflexota bacterium]
MELKLTEAQKMAKTNVRDFLQKELVPIVHERDKQGPFTHDELVDFRKKLDPIGFGSFDISSMASGDTDPISMAIIGEEVFGCWASLAAAIGLAGQSALVAFGPEKMRQRLLPRLEAGDLIGCGAITEPNAGSDNRAMQTKAVLDGDHYVINGTKTWVSNATIADVVLLLCKDENDQLTQFLIDREESPFESRELHKLGWRACPTGEIYFDNCRVPKENNVMVMMAELMASGQVGKVLEERGIPEEALTRMASMFSAGPIAALAYARTGMAQAGVGISQWCLEASIDYAKERIQFGKPIGSFQLIQNMITEMVFLTESCRLLSYRTTEALADGSPEFRMLSSLCKAYVCETAVKVTTMGLQVHGANGLSDDLPIERYFRDARTLTIPDGATEINKLVAGREILGLTAYK